MGLLVVKIKGFDIVKDIVHGYQALLIVLSTNDIVVITIISLLFGRNDDEGHSSKMSWKDETFMNSN